MLPKRALRWGVVPRCLNWYAWLSQLGKSINRGIRPLRGRMGASYGTVNLSCRSKLYFTMRLKRGVESLRDERRGAKDQNLRE